MGAATGVIDAGGVLAAASAGAPASADVPLPSAAATAWSASRGASEQVRLRSLREGIAQVRQALEIAMTQTKDKHKVIDKGTAASRDGA